MKIIEARPRRLEQATAVIKRKLAFEAPLAKRVTRADARALANDTTLPDTTLAINSDESTVLYTPDCPHWTGAANTGHLHEVDAQQSSRDDYQ